VLTVSVPDQEWLDDLGPLPDGVHVVPWDLETPPPDPAIEVVVPPYLGDRSRLARLADLPELRLVQTLTAGYEDVLAYLPDGVALANAAGVHDASTAELAVGLTIAALRGIPAHVRRQERGVWEPTFGRSLADRRVLLIGYGGVGAAVARRLEGFECAVTLVASQARAGVHAVDALPQLLPDHDVVILTVPLTDATTGLVDAAFLAALPDGALVVNVARGGVVVTDALLAEVGRGRIHAAVDVIDPEPLPAGHPLWSEPGFLMTPHIGGASSAFRPRALALIGELLQGLVAGRPDQHIVVPGAGGTAAAPA
jgi:phosphoglycerate dehydrogenase-like enzyme